MKKEYKLSRLRKRAGPVRTVPEAAKVQISIRLDGSVLAQLKEEAQRLGVPYQTLLGSVLHQYVNGELIAKRTVALLKELQSA